MTTQHTPARIARRLATLTISSFLVLGAAGTAAAATDTDPSLPDYPRIRAHDLVAYDTDDGRIVCKEFVSDDKFECQKEGNSDHVAMWNSGTTNAHNTVVFNLTKRTGKKHSTELRSRQPNMKVKTLKEGKKYEYGGIVVQGKKGKLYFSSPKHGTRGEVHDDGWKIRKAD